MRTDLHPAASILAHVDQVTGTARRTTLGHAPAQVGLVEHVLAALAGLRIDNCRIELDGPEPPGMDGSAFPFAIALRTAGFVGQYSRRRVVTPLASTSVSHGPATLTLHPADTDELRITYLLDYGWDSPIPRQRFTCTITPQTFANEIAPCRTFVLQAEADDLQRQGVGRHIKPSDILVFGPHGPLENRLRFGDEPARHKVLDIIGDLALLGCD